MDLVNARRILLEEECTCVLCRGTQVQKSHLRGIAPLLQWLDSGTDLRGFSCADKVVGRAAAFLYCLLGVRAVYAPKMTDAAAEILRAAGIEASCDIRIPHILNHRRDGLCPMEQATQNAHAPQQALTAIREALKKLSS